MLKVREIVVRKKRRKYTLITDALYYLTEHAGSIDRAQGVVIGLMSAIMSIKPCGYEDAIAIVRDHLPNCYRENALPAKWRDDILERIGR